jgi:hypothetical protein
LANLPRRRISHAKRHAVQITARDGGKWWLPAADRRLGAVRWSHYGGDPTVPDHPPMGAFAVKERVLSWPGDLVIAGLAVGWVSS